MTEGLLSSSPQWEGYLPRNDKGAFLILFSVTSCSGLVPGKGGAPFCHAVALLWDRAPTTDDTEVLWLGQRHFTGAQVLDEERQVKEIQNSGVPFG